MNGSKIFDRKNGFHPIFVAFLMGFSFLGLLCSALIEYFFFKKNDVNTPNVLFAIQIFFGFIWCFTLMLIIPVQILYYRRKNRVDDLMPKATIKDALGLAVGVFEPDAKLPKWIAFPILAFLWLLVGIFVIIIIGILISFFVDKFFLG